MVKARIIATVTINGHAHGKLVTITRVSRHVTPLSRIHDRNVIFTVNVVALLTDHQHFKKINTLKIMISYCIPVTTYKNGYKIKKTLKYAEGRPGAYTAFNRTWTG
jgi:hypothetical protein